MSVIDPSLYAFDGRTMALAQYFRSVYPYGTISRLLRGSTEQSRRYLATQSAHGWRHWALADARQRHRVLSAFADNVHGLERWMALHLGVLYVPPLTNLPVFRTEREVVFDMDLNKWDDPRHRPTQLRTGILCECALHRPDGCCADCWVFVELAAVFVRAQYTDKLGLGNPLWVFSGKKGVHCWFGNERARHLLPAQRQQLCDILQSFFEPGTLARLAQDTSGVIAGRLRGAFEQCVVGGTRQLFARDTAWAWLCSLNPACARLENTTSLARWQAFVQTARRRSDVMRVVLEFALPLMDVQVSAVNFHTVKAPFSVHTQTSRVACPLHESELVGFDPNARTLTVAEVVRNPAVLAPAIALMESWLSENGYHQ